MSMEGVLFKWGSKGMNVAFRSPVVCPAKNVVLIGGLTDGLLPVPYTLPLAASLQSRGWGLVQTLLTSSYTGYGTSSLEQDAEELDTLLSFLCSQLQCNDVVFVGHSTGCQNIVHYLGRDKSENRSLVKGAILQGPVSDREYLSTLPETQNWIDLARDMVHQGKSQELMPRAASEPAPITAERYLSLAGKGGMDDLFSSDLSDEELALRLGHMARTPSMVVFSESDEYVPENVDKRNLLTRLCKAMGGAKGVMIKGGDHSLTVSQDEAVKHMDDFVVSL